MTISFVSEACLLFTKSIIYAHLENSIFENFTAMIIKKNHPCRLIISILDLQKQSKVDMKVVIKIKSKVVIAIDINFDRKG